MAQWLTFTLYICGCIVFNTGDALFLGTKFSEEAEIRLGKGYL